MAKKFKLTVMLCAICLGTTFFWMSAEAAGLKIALATRVVENEKTYKIIQVRKSYKTSNGDKLGEIIYQYPELNGNSKTIKSFNRRQKKKANKVIKNESKMMKNCVSDYESGYGPFELGEYYFHNYCEKSYCKNGVYGFKNSNYSFLGGATTKEKDCVIYSAKRGKYLKLKDLLSGNIKRKIKKALKKQQPGWYEDYEMYVDSGLYSYYISGRKVYICFISFNVMSEPMEIGIKIDKKIK